MFQNLILAFLTLCVVAISTIANPIENDNLNPDDFYQGDIKLTPEEQNNQRSGRLGTLNTRARWPKDSRGRVIIPYTIQASSGYSKKCCINQKTF